MNFQQPENISGCLSWNEFVQQLQHFVEVIGQHDSSWSTIKHKESGKLYACKKVVLPWTEVKFHDDDDDEEEETNEMELLDSDSHAIDILHKKLISFEYHIVYSQSYSVPVLYFRAFKTNGRMLSLDEIWQLMPISRLSQQSNLAMITQFEHPLLFKPFFAVHPCHTESLMKTSGQVFNQIHKQDSKKFNFNYILSWLSCVGPMAALRLDLQLVNMFTN